MSSTVNRIAAVGTRVVAASLPGYHMQKSKSRASYHKQRCGIVWNKPQVRLTVCEMETETGLMLQMILEDALIQGFCPAVSICVIIDHVWCSSHYCLIK